MAAGDSLENQTTMTWVLLSRTARLASRISLALLTTSPREQKQVSVQPSALQALPAVKASRVTPLSPPSPPTPHPEFPACAADPRPPQLDLLWVPASPDLGPYHLPVGQAHRWPLRPQGMFQTWAPIPLTVSRLCLRREDMHQTCSAMHLVPSLEVSSLDLLCLHTPVRLALCTTVWVPIRWALLTGLRVASMVLQVTTRVLLIMAVHRVPTTVALVQAWATVSA